jgi:hypothetical protein
MKTAISIGLGILILAAISAGGWLFVDSLLKADPGITAAVIGAIAVMVGGIWSHYSSRRREINSRHFIEKKNAYMRLVDLIFDLFKSVKGEGEVPESEMMNRLFDFKRELMVWGDGAVIDALSLYETRSADLAGQGDLSESLLVVDDLLRAIRRDLGHNDSGLKRGSLVGLLLISDDREKLLSKKLKGSGNDQ